MVICALGVFLASNPRAMRMDRGGETLTGVEWVTGKGFKSSGKAWSSSGSSSLLGLEEENEVEEEACWGSSSPRKKRRSGRCSSPASFFGGLRRSSGKVEGLQWWGRWWSSSMAWSLRGGEWSE